MLIIRKARKLITLTIETNKMKILTIKNNISYLPQVIALGDKNRNILGFLPKSAFEEHASKDEIIISVNQSENKLTAYLLYRSNRSSPKNFTYPARILWYVTKDKNNTFHNDKSVRACSYLDEVVVDYPKKLFSRFHKLGIYSWNDVYSTAKKDVNNKIQSILFSNTVLFKNPVYISDITKIWNKYNRSKFHIQSPIYIKEEIFKEIYQLGQNLL